MRLIVTHSSLRHLEVNIRFIVTHTSLRYLEATIRFIVTQLIKTSQDRYRPRDILMRYE
jgi:hypothetical protein